MVCCAIPANPERKARPPCSRQPCQPSLYFLPQGKMFGNGTLQIINLRLHSDSPGRAEAGKGFSKSAKWMAGFQHFGAWLEHTSNDCRTWSCQMRHRLVFVISILSPPCSLSFLSLSKMGEQLICKTNPTSDLVRKQLSHLKDQWQTLKQTAANQKRALGGAKSLQEFNKKVDKLEAWIKEKVQRPSTTRREKLFSFCS